jgi:DNA-binding MarR family transcriptional regulator
MAEKYGGDCTLNELRVMNQIVYWSLEGRTCCVTDLHKETGIPMPTVSRAVANLQINGWLSDKRDLADGRKRIISLSPSAQEQTSREIREAIQWFNDFRKHGLPG